jgi:hypothetical protein
MSVHGEVRAMRGAQGTVTNGDGMVTGLVTRRSFATVASPWRSRVPVTAVTAGMGPYTRAPARIAIHSFKW